MNVTTICTPKRQRKLDLVTVVRFSRSAASRRILVDLQFWVGLEDA